MTIRGVRLAIALLLLALGSGVARAAPAGIALEPCVARAAGMDAKAAFESSARFDCSGDQLRFGPGDFWVSMRGFALQGSPADPLTLRTGSIWQDRVTLYVRYGDGTIAALPPVTSHQTSRHLELGALIRYDIPPRTAPVTGILAHVEGASNVRGILLAPRLEPASAVAASNLALGALFAGFAGLCLALLCYNFALWSALRHSFQLSYCAMVLAIMVYAFSSSGALAWAFPGIDNNDRLRINYGALTCAGIGALVFMRQFFEAGVVPPWLDRAINAGSIFAAGSTLLLVMLAPWQMALLDELFILSFIAMFFSVLAITACAWQRNSRFLTVFVLAWAAPVAGGLLRSLNGFGLIRYSFWLDNSTVIAMAAEALLSSIAIAYRIRLVSEERDRARAGESIARAEADTDALTGLLNRRAFLSAAIGSAGPQRLLLIDIDHFKLVNDRIGHDGGDEVLRIFARIVKAAAGPDNIAARLGGEEFALLVSEAQVRLVDPARLLSTIRAADLEFGLPVTASIGIAEGPIGCDDDWRALYRQADAALYRAKADGRDRVCTITPLARAA